MEQFRAIIELEEERLGQITGEMRQTLAGEESDRQKKDREIAELKRQKMDAPGWREKREIDEAIERCRAHYAMRHYQNGQVLSNPYFGVLQLEDDDLGKLSYCLGRQSFFDRNGKAIVIDWREAPISRLYYEYEAGELYEEEIRGRDRTGALRHKLQVDTAGGELRRITENGTPLMRCADGSWTLAGKGGGVLSRKEEKSDHRLPEITALISPDQFRAITRPESNIVLLQGGAGSGKTTVGLHRIAYLAYQDGERFRPGRILVVMFNRSLQNYISRILPELGVESGVQVETYHGWAGKLLRAAGLHFSYTSDSIPEAVVRIKKHPRLLQLVDRYLDGLLKKSCAWLLEQLDKSGDPERNDIRVKLEGLSRFEDLVAILDTDACFFQSASPQARKALRSRLLARFTNHATDLHALLTERALLEKTFGAEKDIENDALDQTIEWQENLRNRNVIDFCDTAILLWLLGQKGVAAARPGLAHVMVDEAQDLSEIELATLLFAADERQSITICGDMAQKIKGDVSFNTREGFAGFVRARQQRSGTTVNSDTLVVGFRATRPIMELAWHVLGAKPSMAVARDGDPVRIVATRSKDETISTAKAILEDYLEKRPQALIAAVTRYKTDADRVFEALKNAGLLHVRRHERDDFSFKPGIVVTNAHQVKGLEFSAVLVINPSSGQYRDDHESRMLLHVVITRAADHLWIVGDQPMAYGLEATKGSDGR
ncbi:MAG: UvrD-helicase domain-containing protein [Syntrophobacteraceae bacterium]|nr:UvrD-helicase domain-containing protein [Syntrophobacteraceae bacterium]